MKKRKPWNRVDEQVYSIASLAEKGGGMNMNIATYITPVTMKPKQYMIAVYRNTQTHQNIFKDKKPFLLQGLSTENLSLVKTLGKKSGKVYNKEGYILKHKPLFYEGIPYFANASFVLVCKGEKYIQVGDHDIVIASISKALFHSDLPLLSTKILQDNKIIG